MPNYDVLILERPSPCMNLMEFCELHGGKLPEPMVRDIMLQLVKAAHHCCESGVLHNDIKPGNVLINMQTLQIKLIDFGGGDFLNETPYNYCPGTLLYSPPEWHHHKQYFGHSITIWTLGILFYQLLHGDLPFLTKEECVNGHLALSLGLSKDCWKTITWLLQKDPKSRPTIRQILRDKWFMGGPSYIQRFPVIGGAVAKLLELCDYHIKK